MLIVGIPGSGKTYIAKTEFVPAGFHLIDDPRTLQDISDGVSEALLNSAVGVVITDPNLVYPRNVANAIQFLDSIAVKTVQVIYLENNSHKAKANLEHRAKTGEDRGPINVEHFSKLYVIPDGVVTKEIYQTSPENLTNNTEDIT